ncbi:hypothetical protein JW964_05100 [candidate division KSB1 bacterium]|nr:hypothetical protein [candidate division KSB1 bacterium]
MKKILLIVGASLLIILTLMLSIALYHIRDRHPGYTLNLKLPEKSVVTKQFRVGLAREKITPVLPDKWVDADNNARFEPEKGDKYIDENQNGKFDAYWLAGFHQNRPAIGVHDDIWARAIVFDDGNIRVALVVLDAIGLFHDDVITIRQMLAAEKLPIDHLIISSTHVHEVPDLMGLWGEKLYTSGVKSNYLKLVQEQTIKAVRDACYACRPAYIKLGRINSTASDLVIDTRPPKILDDAIHLMHFCDLKNDTTLGILMNWGNHPEALGSDNLLITADFCHYWLDGLERGIRYDNQVLREGIGGIAVFANGAIGGLMTPLDCNIYDPWMGKYYEKPTFEKAQALGHRLASLVMDELIEGSWETVQAPQIQLHAKTFEFPLHNITFKIAGAIGLFNRGFIGFSRLRSEINLLSIGDAWILTIPGEINPEIVNGGVENPQGADFAGDPIEFPPIRQLMKGKYNFVIGLANDEVGYIMPKTHWDTEPPYTYRGKKPYYGEINSLGPEAGPTLHREVKKMIDEF